MVLKDDALAAANEGIKRVRDRRRSFRQELEEVFDRQTFVTILFLGPAGKTIEMLLLGQPRVARRFAVAALFGLVIALYWRRLAAAASDAADTVEEATAEAADE